MEVFGEALGVGSAEWGRGGGGDAGGEPPVSQIVTIEELKCRNEALTCVPGFFDAKKLLGQYAPAPGMIPIPEMLMHAPGAVPGEVGGVVVGVGDVVSVVGISGVLERLVVAGRRVEVVVDGEADVAQVAPN